jgi:hypothetical protein
MGAGSVMTSASTTGGVSGSALTRAVFLDLGTPRAHWRDFAPSFGPECRHRGLKIPRAVTFSRLYEAIEVLSINEHAAERGLRPVAFARA